MGHCADTAGLERVEDGVEALKGHAGQDENRTDNRDVLHVKGELAHQGTQRPGEGEQSE